MICDGAYNFSNLPKTPGVPVFLNKDDVASVILRRYLAVERSVAKRLYGKIEKHKTARWERSTAARVRLVLACSEVDRRELLDLCPSARITVIPNVVDTDHYSPSAHSEPCTVLFQGGIDWHPNRDAVEFFLAEILPALRRLVPAVRFRIAGRCPPAFSQRYQSVPGVEFTGRVLDMRVEIARATVCVVPLRIGSGTRLKILEAGAMAKPIVSTTLGAEGLELNDREDIILADEPRAFAEAVAGLLAARSRREQIGWAARLHVVKHHSLPVFQSSLRHALAQGLR
ncbi:MAG: hypothetical protein A3F70_18730 [Acidobacteria bacterium RIFCSPLOWO2_12_FULL_67_14]|nr:MAG: hypothetical protein A3F70_18730 [Acidobacteria bacterium RIFCSPLOWO2_12_FULL_67_14]